MAPSLHVHLPGEALRAAKRAMRQQLRAERDAMPAAARVAASASIVGRMVARADFSGAKTVLVTLPFRNEWDTRALVRAALDAGKMVAAPRVDDATRMLELRAISDRGARCRPQARKASPSPSLHCPSDSPGRDRFRRRPRPRIRSRRTSPGLWRRFLRSAAAAPVAARRAHRRRLRPPGRPSGTRRDRTTFPSTPIVTESRELSVRR